MNVHELKDKYPDQFERTFQKWAEDGPYDEWWYSIYETAREDGEKMGFNIEDINFSGFWSQGDGACWNGTIRLDTFMDKCVDLTEPRWHILRAIFEEGFMDTIVQVETRGRYCHSVTMSIGTWYSLNCMDEDTELEEGVYAGASVVEMYNEIGGDDLMNELVETAEKAARDFADQIYKNLEDEYEYLTSYEVFIEECEANDVEFEAEEDEADC